MKFTYKPIHLVSLDEQRKEFAVTDLEGAIQVGLRGKHSDTGGGYGFNLYEYIAMKAVHEYATENGITLFRGQNDYTNEYGNLLRAASFGAERFISGISPSDNSGYLYNDNQDRRLPENLLLHSSVKWFHDLPLNSVHSQSGNTINWTRPFYRPNIRPAVPPSFIDRIGVAVPVSNPKQYRYTWLPGPNLDGPSYWETLTGRKWGL